MIYRHVFPSRKELLVTRATSRDADPHGLLKTCRLLRWEANDEFTVYLKAQESELRRGSTRSELDQIYNEINRDLDRGHPAYLPFPRIAESKSQQHLAAFCLAKKLRARCIARKTIRTGSVFVRLAVTQQMKDDSCNYPSGGTMPRNADIDRRVREI